MRDLGCWLRVIRGVCFGKFFFSQILKGSRNKKEELTNPRLLKPICPNEDSRTHLGGIFKGLQSAGAAVAFHLNTIGIAGTTEIAVNWGLLAGSILIAAPMVYKKAQNEIDCPAEESNSSISP